jgi:hypothetical protein
MRAANKSGYLSPYLTFCGGAPYPLKCSAASSVFGMTYTFHHLHLLFNKVIQRRRKVDFFVEKIILSETMSRGSKREVNSASISGSIIVPWGGGKMAPALMRPLAIRTPVC